MDRWRVGGREREIGRNRGRDERRDGGRCERSTEGGPERVHRGSIGGPDRELHVVGRFSIRDAFHLWRLLDQLFFLNELQDREIRQV